MIIAIDGPAASGKGTLARRLAAHLGYAYLDTGALYRAVALKLLRAGLSPADEDAGSRIAAGLTEAELEDPALRSDEVGALASQVAALPRVRAALLAFQRDFARRAPGAVLDGRDIGTVVCPQADVKLFVTASLDARAGRRWRELLAAGAEADEAMVRTDIAKRDARDAGRAHAPLQRADDAHLLDTTDFDIDTAFAAALDMVRAHAR